jgi:hypothetical protein
MYKVKRGKEGEKRKYTNFVSVLHGKTVNSFQIIGNLSISHNYVSVCFVTRKTKN